LCNETNLNLLLLKDNPKAWAALIANVNANYIHNSDTKTSFSMEKKFGFCTLCNNCTWPMEKELQKNLKDKNIFEQYLNGNN
jgi:hypothetical protein